MIDGTPVDWFILPASQVLAGCLQTLQELDLYTNCRIGKQEDRQIEHFLHSLQLTRVKGYLIIAFEGQFSERKFPGKMLITCS